MTFTETIIPGAFLIDPERPEDERGFFARVWCAREFKAHGLPTHLAQASVSFTKRRGTLRGMHWQAAPHAETKLIRCTQGGIHDIIVDLRPGSPGYLKHVAVELTAENHRMLFVPEGCAHGFQTLADNTEIHYQMTEFYAPDFARGARWNDHAFGLRWPIENPFLNDRDRTYPDYVPAR